MTTIIAVDPGKQSGIAVLQGGPQNWILRELEQGNLTPRSIWGKLQLWRDEDEETIVVIEGQFFPRHPNAHHNPHDVAKVVSSASKWSCLAELAGYQVVEDVKASTWQSVIFGGKEKRAVRKAQSKAMTQLISGRSQVKENEADALCIGLWYIKANICADFLVELK